MIEQSKTFIAGMGDYGYGMILPAKEIGLYDPQRASPAYVRIEKVLADTFLLV